MRSMMIVGTTMSKAPAYVLFVFIAVLFFATIGLRDEVDRLAVRVEYLEGKQR